jgi:hypothetical protein
MKEWGWWIWREGLKGTQNIPVQPTSKSRRQLPVGGRRCVGLGRPCQGSHAEPKERGLSSQLLPRRKKSPPQTFTLCQQKSANRKNTCCKVTSKVTICDSLHFITIFIIHIYPFLVLECWSSLIALFVIKTGYKNMLGSCFHLMLMDIYICALVNL